VLRFCKNDTFNKLILFSLKLIFSNSNKLVKSISDKLFFDKFNSVKFEKNEISEAELISNVELGLVSFNFFMFCASETCISPSPFKSTAVLFPLRSSAYKLAVEIFDELICKSLDLNSESIKLMF